MSGGSDEQDEYVVQQKVSYRMYEQEQKVLLRCRYPFLSPVQISCKVKDRWNRLRQDAKKFYTKSVLVKAPNKDQTNTTSKSKGKNYKVRSKLDVDEGETCDPSAYQTDSVPHPRSILTLPVSRRLQKDHDSIYTSDFYSSSVESPNSDSGEKAFCPKLFESPESPPHHQFDIFTQKSYTKSKLPLRVPVIIQKNHSTLGILKGSRTDNTPKAKAVKGRVSFSTDKNGNLQKSGDVIATDNCNQDDDSEDEYNAVLIRRTDDSYNFDDIDQHNMFVEEENKLREVNIHQDKDFNEKIKASDREMLKNDKKYGLNVSNYALEGKEKEKIQKESLKKKAEGKNMTQSNSGNMRGKKRKGGLGVFCSQKRGEKKVVDGNVIGNEENTSGQTKAKRQSRRAVKENFTGVNVNSMSKNSIYMNSLSKDIANGNSQSNDSANGNSQSNDSANWNSQSNESANGNCQLNDSANGNSQSNDSANWNSQSNESSFQDRKSPIQKSMKTRSSLRTEEKSAAREVQSLSVPKKEVSSELKPSFGTKTRDYDLTPEQGGETTYITPQMDDDVYTHNLHEASKVPRKSRRSSQWKETKSSDITIGESNSPNKRKQRSFSRRLNGGEKSNTEIKISLDTFDESECERNDAKVSCILVDASGDAKIPGSPPLGQRILRSQTKLITEPAEENYQTSENYSNYKVIVKPGELFSSDSCTIMDEEYDMEDSSDDETESEFIGQSDSSKALVQALLKMKQTVGDDNLDERSSPKLLSPALSGISQLSSVSSDSSATNSQSTVPMSIDKGATQGLCEMFGDMTPPDKQKPQHSRRMLASSHKESSSNFAQLFRTKDIFC
ncbi:uncharacterized protein LOC132553126 [Ylistrum balloti]|uniref:uncharacterized protein LOC132553126 n=1 Tax=Ylistrum balloti TaxID=509963 RepID=UPI002905EB47|nr:uncharacterized protein LOC132553126 [Ylistrum balloti]